MDAATAAIKPWTGYYTKAQLLEYLIFPNYQPLNYGEVEKTEMNATTGGKLYRLTLERR